MKYEELKVGKKCVDKFFDYVNHKWYVYYIE